MEALRFANLGYAWLLMGAPALLAATVLAKHWGLTRLKRFASPQNLSWILGKQASRALQKRDYLQIAGYVFLVIALMRPQANPSFEEVRTEGLDIIVALDISRSMDAEDMYPSRLRKAKKTMQVLLDKLSGDRVGIVIFAGSAHLICPLTSDYEVVRTFLQSIDTNLMDNQGTNIEAALREASLAFKRGAQNVTSTEAPAHIVILLSDGEETTGAALKAASEARNNGIIVHALAYGSERGVPIPIRDNNGVLTGHKHDDAGNIVVTKVNPQALQSLASAGGGTFGFSSLDDSEVDSIVKNSQNAQRTANAQIQVKIYQEFFWIPLILGLICLLVSYAPELKLAKNIVALTVLFIIFPPTLRAETETKAPVNLPWYSVFWDKLHKDTETAKQLLLDKRAADATKVLQQEQAKDPSSALLNYNVATSMANEDRFDDAAKALDDPSITSDAKLKNFAKFNAAGIAAKKKDNDTAASLLFDTIRSLEKKATLDQDEHKLLAQARKNLEVLLSPAQQQKNKDEKEKEDKKKEQSEQQKDKGNSQDQKKSNDGSGSDSSKDNGKDKKDADKNRETDKKQDGSKPENGEPQPPSKNKKQFDERKDLSEQDAKRILESLKNQESNLQKRLLKSQIEKPKDKQDAQKNDKDW